jgi:hypothetical protein
MQEVGCCRNKGFDLYFIRDGEIEFVSRDIFFLTAIFAVYGLSKIKCFELH